MQRKLLTSDQAKPRSTQHKKPCSDCPFARTALPGWLGTMTIDEWLGCVHGEGWIDCHTTTNQQCAGAAIYRANMAKLPIDKAQLRLEPDRKTVFATPMEFIKHHSRKATRKDFKT